MRITIEYESSWRNSFLDGSNNEPLPKQGRKFIGSMTNLNNPDNFIERTVSIDTVMGILNRLIGDQRKLYQARKETNYFFDGLESQVSFTDKVRSINDEVSFIRNITGSTDQNSFTGMVKVNDPIFTSDYSAELWSVIATEVNSLCDFLIDDVAVESRLSLDPLTIIGRLEELNKLKPLPNEGKLNRAYQVLVDKFEKFNGLNKKGELIPISLYCSALYLQLDRLALAYDVSTAKTKAGGLSGISNNGFTKKDFMSRYSSGEKKRIWGNPYIREEFVSGVGKTRRLLTKANGQLEISIAVEKNRALEIQSLISNAGVSSFYLGKKGLAYVSDIRI